MLHPEPHITFSHHSSLSSSHVCFLKQNQEAAPLGHHRAPGWTPCVIQLLPTSVFFTHNSVYTSMLLSRFFPLSPFPTVSVSPFSTSVFPFVIFYLLFIIWPCGAACGNLVPWLETESTPAALEARSLNHWTTRQVLALQDLSSSNSENVKS